MGAGFDQGLDLVLRQTGCEEGREEAFVRQGKIVQAKGNQASGFSASPH
jgi:hypothetical protein